MQGAPGISPHPGNDHTGRLSDRTLWGPWGLPTPATVQGKSSVWVSPSSRHGRSHPATPQAAVHVFLERPADARWARTRPPSSRVYALITDGGFPSHRCRRRAWRPSLSPSSSSSSDAKGIERARAPLAPFWEPHIRTFRNSCMGGN